MREFLDLVVARGGPGIETGYVPAVQLLILLHKTDQVSQYLELAKNYLF